MDITGALQAKTIFGWIWIMVLNTPFNNISVTGHEELFEVTYPRETQIKKN